MFHKHRLEALSDAVFAIVMTLLVLELKVPHDVPPGHLWEALREGGGEWFSFALTFIIASIFWTLQHQVFDVLEETGAEALITTFVVLGLVSILPFSTALMGKYGRDHIALTLYFCNQTAIALALVVKMELANIRHRLHHDPAAREIRFRLARIALVMAAAAVGGWFLPASRMFYIPVALGLVFRTVQVAARTRRKAVHLPLNPK